MYSYFGDTTLGYLPPQIPRDKSTFDISAVVPHIPRRMKSMTGYGRGECAQSGFKITVELSSVNRKQSEISVYLPRELEALESRIRDEINRRVARGRLTVKVSMHAANGSWPGRVKLNAALAR